MQNEITENTTLAKILKTPNAKEILKKYNLPCLQCPMAAYEMGVLEIGKIAKMYNIDIKGLLNELNQN